MPTLLGKTSLLALGLWLGATSEGAAVRGFEERSLTLPPQAQPGQVAICDVWAPRASGTAATTSAISYPPVLLSHFKRQDGDVAFALWRLGPDLRLAQAAMNPAAVLIPNEASMRFGQIRYCLARLQKDSGPSLLFAAPRGVIAYPPPPADAAGAAAGLGVGRRLADAAFPEASEVRMTRYLIPAVFAFDLDGDQVDELVIPSEDGGWRIYGGVAESGPHGVMRQIGELPRAPMAATFSMSVDGANPPGGKGLPPRRSLLFSRSQSGGVELRDVNGDGRLDVLIKEVEAAAPDGQDCRLNVITQSAPLDFASRSPHQTVRYRSRDLRREWMDINGDGWLDLVETHGNFDLVAPLMIIHLYLARGAVTDLRDARPDFSYEPRNPYGLVVLDDWDADGDLDLAFTHVDRAFGSASDMVRMLANDDMDVSVKFYEMSGGLYARVPSCQLGVKVRTDCLSANYPPELLIQTTRDMTGDGRPDVLIRRRRDLLSVFSFDVRSGRMAQEPAVEFNVSEYSLPRVDDLDADGRPDVWWFDPESRTVRCLLQP